LEVSRLLLDPALIPALLLLKAIPGYDNSEGDIFLMLGVVA
jgi:hypothetical protein